MRMAKARENGVCNTVRLDAQFQCVEVVNVRLQGMRVGTLDPSEPAVAVDHSDPYSRDPERHPALVMHNLRPCNAEVSGSTGDQK